MCSWKDVKYILISCAPLLSWQGSWHFATKIFWEILYLAETFSGTCANFSSSHVSTNTWHQFLHSFKNANNIKHWPGKKKKDWLFLYWYWKWPDHHHRCLTCSWLLWLLQQLWPRFRFQWSPASNHHHQWFIIIISISLLVQTLDIIHDISGQLYSLAPTTPGHSLQVISIQSCSTFSKFNSIWFDLIF